MAIMLVWKWHDTRFSYLSLVVIFYVVIWNFEQNIFSSTNFIKYIVNEFCYQLNERFCSRHVILLDLIWWYEILAIIWLKQFSNWLNYYSAQCFLGYRLKFSEFSEQCLNAEHCNELNNLIDHTFSYHECVISFIL